MSKVISSGSGDYAKGGTSIGKVSEFMKVPDDFRTDTSNATDEVFGKGGDGQAKGKANPPSKNKELC